MTYDPALAERIRAVAGKRRGVTEKEMFGGIAFLLDGKMFVGIVKNDLMVRVGPDAHEGALREAHVRPMDFAGRPMKGYVYVSPEGLAGAPALARWVDAAHAHAATLPAKKAKPATKGAKKKPVATKKPGAKKRRARASSTTSS